MDIIDCTHMAKLIPSTKGKTFVGKCSACGVEVRALGMSADLLCRCANCSRAVWCCDFCKHLTTKNGCYECSSRSACTHTNPSFEAVLILVSDVGLPSLEES